MATIVTRAGKGSPLTNTEVDANFTNLNTDKAELSGATFTGEITANGGIALGDNDKATFGAGDDLQIYHDGSHSYIKDAGSGILYVQGSGQVRVGGSDGTTGVEVNEGGDVKLRYSNATKLATTSTGIDVTGNVDLPDNGKLLLGASDDLQLYHDGNNSYINDAGTGALLIRGSNVSLAKYTGETMVNAFADGRVDLYYDNAIKLTTVTGGIDVTGTATMDGLVVSGAQNSKVAYFDDSSEAGHRQLQFTSSNNGQYWDINSQGTSGGLGGVLTLSTRSTDRLNIASNGDISFYEDTGTTPKFVWSSANETIAIGTGASSTATISAYSRTVSSNLPSALRIIENTGASSYWDIGANNGSSPNLNFYANSNTTPRVTFASSGNVGIGTSSPSAGIDVVKTGSVTVGNFETDGNSTVTIKRTGASATTSSIIASSGGKTTLASSGYTTFDTSGTERMRIDSSGNVGIGTSSPSSYGHSLVVAKDSSGGATYATITNTNANQFLNLGINADVAEITWDNADSLAFGTTAASTNEGQTFEAMRITSAGNVGIGTSSPTRPLTVSKAGAQIVGEFINPTASQTARIYVTCGTQTGQIQQYGNTHATDPNTMRLNTTAGDITIAPSSVERVRVTTAGNVGIGESDPFDKLVVRSSDANSVQSALSLKNGDIGASAGVALNFVVDDPNDVVTAAIYGQRTASAYHQGSLQFLTRNPAGTVTEKMRIDSSGKVSIGSLSAAGGSLGVNHAVAGTYPKASGIGLGATSTAYTVASNGGTVSFTGGAGLYAQNTAASGNPTNLVFWTNHTGAPAERMRIDSSGNLGIGTTSPFGRLSVDVAAGAPASSGNMTNGFTVHNSNGGRAIQLGVNESGSYNYLQSSYVNNANVAVDMAFFTGANERMRIDSAGNVGIGTDSPDALLHTAKTQASGDVPIILENSGISGVATSSIVFAGNGGSGAEKARIKSAVYGDGYMSFHTNDDTEKMRIDASGNLLVGTTTSGGKVTINSPSNDGLNVAVGNNRLVMISKRDNDGDHIRFLNSSGANVGNINVTGTTTTYTTSSDQRLKENIADADDAGSKIDAIQVRKYDWKADGSHQDYGMIAQELVEVAPEAVTVPEDSEEMMGVDYSKLVPMLIKEIQSLRNRVAQLETGE